MRQELPTTKQLCSDKKCQGKRGTLIDASNELAI